MSTYLQMAQQYVEGFCSGYQCAQESRCGISITVRLGCHEGLHDRQNKAFGPGGPVVNELRGDDVHNTFSDADVGVNVQVEENFRFGFSEWRQMAPECMTHDGLDLIYGMQYCEWYLQACKSNETTTIQDWIWIYVKARRSVQARLHWKEER